MYRPSHTQQSSQCSRNKGKNEHKTEYSWIKWVLPLTGLISLMWFLVRVIPKPSRTTYPCQRMAAPLASGFVVWIAGVIGSTRAYHKAKQLWRKKYWSRAAIFFAIAITAIWISLNVFNENDVCAEFIPHDPPNFPMGVGKGIYPGRVVWVHDPNATHWDGETGEWWDDTNTDQDRVNNMVSRAIRSLTGQLDDADAWDTLFRHFNRIRDNEDRGYQVGEKIAIKINMNQDWGNQPWESGAGMPSPHVIYSLLYHLIHVVGVPGQDIIVYDAGKYVGDPIYEKIRSHPNPDFQNLSIVVVSWQTKQGRKGVVHDPNNLVYFSSPQISESTAELPECVTKATYLINMALLRPHFIPGITLCGKNHFGSIYFPGIGWYATPLHASIRRDNAMGSYSPIVDLMGHQELGGKTLLYMIDALYAAEDNSGDVIRWLSFGDDWTSSLFMSQDPVAIDSVGLDFIRNEPRADGSCRGQGVDNYLHEAALAHEPPSDMVYDPENDGIRLQSLGVHEHWNNPVDKQYSRNLRIDDGIELVVPRLRDTNGLVENLTTGVCYHYISDAINDANSGSEIVILPGTYYESVDFKGKNLVFRSTDPYDPNIVNATVIVGDEQAIRFTGGENKDCVIAGLTVIGTRRSISCINAGPTIIHCRLVDSAGPGIELDNDSHPTIINCLIAGNRGDGIHMVENLQGNDVQFNEVNITNCTIVGNMKHGICVNHPVVVNSIIRDNGFENNLAQIVSEFPAVCYSNSMCLVSGKGNIDIDPGFVVSGYWANTDESNKAVWIHGDYHLGEQSPCINAGDPDFFDERLQFDMDGESRIMRGRVDMGTDEVAF